MKNYFLVFSLFLIPFLMHGQKSGVFMALNQFLETEFFSEFEAIRNQAETSVKQFKRRQHEYSDEQIATIAEAYNSSADRFNATLENIKNDLLHKEKRKFIIAFPEDYSKQVETDLNRAKEYYAQTYQTEIFELTDGEITGASLLTLLPMIIKYASEALGVIKQIQSYVKKFSEDLLNDHLIKPYQFKTWDEIN